MAKKRSRKKKKEPIMVGFRSLISVALAFAAGIIVTLNGVLEIEGIPTWQQLSDLATTVLLGEQTFETAPSEGTLEVHYIDVGQGDSILIKTPEKNLLIDGGDNSQGEAVVDYLKNNGVQNIDTIIATHPHADHIGGLDIVVDSIPTSKVIVPSLPSRLVPETRTYEDFMAAISDNTIQLIEAQVGKQYQMGGGAVITIVGPNGEFGDLNDSSVITRLDFGESSFLFTADAEHGAENAIMDNNIPLDVDVLHLGHHGSSTSSSPEFLSMVTPIIGIASCGIDNEYGHPHKEVVELMGSYGEMYRTDLDGDIRIITDGTTITVYPSNGEELSVAA